MLATQHTHSLSDFRQNASEVLDRLNPTGEAEILTVNGEARAVLVSPAVYDELAREMEMARDVGTIRRSMKQLDEGKGISVEEAHAHLRGVLLAMKAEQEVVKK